MASKNKTFIMIALEKYFKREEKKLLKSLPLDNNDIENLRLGALNTIKGNETEYIDYVEAEIKRIEEKLSLADAREINKLAKAAEKNFGVEPDTIDVMASKRVLSSKESMKLSGTKAGVVIGASVGVLLIGSAGVMVSCGSHKSNQEEAQNQVIIEESSVQSTPIPTPVATPEVIEISAEEKEIQEFAKTIVENTIEASNGMLSSGVAFIDKTLSEDAQKELIAEHALTYYVVANIDDITPAEYINFMQAEHGNVIDNDDMIYNFRNTNVLLYNQMLVATSENKLDFKTLYKNENDQKLLEDGESFIIRYNEAKKNNEKQEIFKELYEYVDSIFNDDLSKLKYSNSALATFINVEFKAWQELAENAEFKLKKGSYPDDELVTRVLTTISKCGMSEGEKQELNVMDETKTSLESINVIRVAETLEDRFETAKADSNIDLYDLASYGQLKEKVIAGIDLTLYNELISFEELQRKATVEAPPVTHSNDSKVSNGQGGTIANSEFKEHNIDSSSPTAKEDYEEAVREETEKQFAEETVTKNEDGKVVDEDELISWAEQGAIDANNGTTSDVPDEYKDAYEAGQNAAEEAKKEVEKEISSTTTFEPVQEQVVNQTEKIEETGFTNEGNNTTVPEPSIPEIVVPDAPSEVTDPNYNETTFVPLGSEEQIVEQTVISETVEGFAPIANSSRKIEVKTITRDEKLQELYSLKNELNNAALEAIQNANLVLSEIEEYGRTK